MHEQYRSNGTTINHNKCYVSRFQSFLKSNSTNYEVKQLMDIDNEEESSFKTSKMTNPINETKPILLNHYFLQNHQISMKRGGVDFVIRLENISSKIKYKVVHARNPRGISDNQVIDGGNGLNLSRDNGKTRNPTLSKYPAFEGNRTKLKKGKGLFA